MKDSTAHVQAMADLLAVIEDAIRTEGLRSFPKRGDARPAALALELTQMHVHSSCARAWVSVGR